MSINKLRLNFGVSQLLQFLALKRSWQDPFESCWSSFKDQPSAAEMRDLMASPYPGKCCSPPCSHCSTWKCHKCPKANASYPKGIEKRDWFTASLSYLGWEFKTDNVLQSTCNLLNCNDQLAVKVDVLQSPFPHKRVWNACFIWGSWNGLFPQGCPAAWLPSWQPLSETAS